MWFVETVKEKEIRDIFGDVLVIIDTWCEKHKTEMWVVEAWDGEHGVMNKKFVGAGFVLVRPPGFMGSVLVALIRVVGR